MKQSQGKPGRPADVRKDRDILRAARALVFSEGPQALTMEKVAQRAGVAKATLYARYTNRDELVQTVLDSEATPIYQALTHPPGNYAQLRAGLCSFIEAATALVFGRRHRRLIPALAAIPQKHRDFAENYRDGLDKTLRMLAAYLEAAAQKNLLRCPVPAESAETLFGMSMGCDLLRLAYGAAPRRSTAAQRQSHAGRAVDAFLSLHAANRGAARR